MHIITHEFENIWCINFKSRICDYLTLKISSLTPYEDHFRKIIYTCIKIFHHHVNHHCWNSQGPGSPAPCSRCTCTSYWQGLVQGVGNVWYKVWLGLVKGQTKFGTRCNKVWYQVWHCLVWVWQSPSGSILNFVWRKERKKHRTLFNVI